MPERNFSRTWAQARWEALEAQAEVAREKMENADADLYSANHLLSYLDGTNQKYTDVADKLRAEVARLTQERDEAKLLYETSMRKAVQFAEVGRTISHW